LKPIYEVLDRFGTITDDTRNMLVDELRKNTEAEVVFHKEQVNRVRVEYDRLKEKQNRLLDTFLDQSITKDIYDKKHQEQQDKIQLLEAEMLEHTKADYEYQTTVATVLSLAQRARSIFERSSDIAQKRAFLSYIVQNPTLKEKKLCFTIASPFNLVLELTEDPIWLRTIDSIRTWFDENTLELMVPDLKNS
jgi:hypothetical protein